MAALEEVVNNVKTLDRYYRAQASKISQVEAATIELQTQATLQNSQLQEMENMCRVNHKRLNDFDQYVHSHYTPTDQMSSLVQEVNAKIESLSNLVAEMRQGAGEPTYVGRPVGSPPEEIPTGAPPGFGGQAPQGPQHFNMSPNRAPAGAGVNMSSAPLMATPTKPKPQAPQKHRPLLHSEFHKPLSLGNVLPPAASMAIDPEANSRRRQVIIPGTMLSRHTSSRTSRCLTITNNRASSLSLVPWEGTETRRV